MIKNKLITFLVCVFLPCAIIFDMCACNAAIQAVDLMKGVSAKVVPSKTADDAFINLQTDFTIKLFKTAISEKSDGNVLISPLSVQLALAMATNGTFGVTKTEMEKLIGGRFNIDELNAYLKSYIDSLPSNKNMKLEIANSIWFRNDADRLQVKKDFLQTNADYYNAQIYKADFDGKTLKDINNWVNLHTDGMIEKIMDEIPSYTVMYLINALVFDAKWDTPYEKYNVTDGIFYDINKNKQNAEMMNSAESVYLDDGKSTGFIKPYYDNKYGFLALLPNGDTDIYEYIENFTADKLINIFASAEYCNVRVSIPKFSYDYSVKMNSVLKSLGVTSAFDAEKADFSKMAHSDNGNIYIDEVIHKTFISVDENGTKAAAITEIGMTDCAAPLEEKYVCLDRPFVYMIIDNSTNIPLFAGLVTSVK